MFYIGYQVNCIFFCSQDTDIASLKCNGVGMWLWVQTTDPHLNYVIINHACSISHLKFPLVIDKGPSWTTNIRTFNWGLSNTNYGSSNKWKKIGG